MGYDDLYDDDVTTSYVNFADIQWRGELLAMLSDDHLRAIRSIIIKEYPVQFYKDTPFWLKLNSLIADNTGDDFD